MPHLLAGSCHIHFVVHIDLVPNAPSFGKNFVNMLQPRYFEFLGKYRALDGSYMHCIPVTLQQMELWTWCVTIIF